MSDPVLELLSKELVSGLYRGEDPAVFNDFLASVDDIICEADSPRNTIIHDMKQDVLLQSMLERLDIDWSARDSCNVLQLFKDVECYPKRSFGLLEHLKHRIKGLTSTLKDLSSDTAWRRKICSQLNESKDKDILGVLAETKQYLKKSKDDLAQAILDLDPDMALKYLIFQTLQDRIEEYRIQWDQFSTKLGRQRTDYGTRLENRYIEVIPIIEQRLHSKCTNYWRNLMWNDTQGEVDLLMHMDNDNYVIVEFKAHVFDIMSAWYQNGPGRDSVKHTLQIDKGDGGGNDVHISMDCPMFIVTTMPIHPYKLPMENRLKRVVRYRAKHNCDIDKTFQYARSLIEDTRLTPSRWYQEHGKEHVIVI